MAGAGALSARFSAVLAASRDAILLTDPDGCTSEVNVAAERMFGRSRGELVGQKPEDVVDLPPGVQDVILSRIAAGERWSGDVQFTRADGSRGVCETTVDGIWEGETLLGTVGISRDVTEQRRLSAALAEAEQRWRLTLDHAPIGIALVALDGRILRVNAALCRMLGYPEPELLARTFQVITHPDDLEADLELLGRLIAGEIPDYQLEKRYLHAAGHEVWGHLSVGLVRDEDGSPLHLVAQLSDVTDRRRRTAHLEQLASRDGLTGLANRVTFLDELEAALHGGSPSCAVAYLDLDDFKTVNDVHGHATGDDLLNLVGQRISAALRPGDVAGRLGGDEFAVLIRQVTSAARGETIARRLLTAVAGSYRIEIPDDGWSELRVGASVGLTLARPGDTAGGLLARADEAMYRAKQAGRGRCELG